MMRKYVAVAGAFVLLVLLIPRGASLYYESTRGRVARAVTRSRLTTTPGAGPRTGP
jgi:hypothetical protein